MELNFNVTGARRKELVDEIAAIDGSPKEYLGVPAALTEWGISTSARTVWLQQMIGS